MVINEQGLLRAMKEAYKADGYEIECVANGSMTEIHLETSRWYVNCEIKNLPRKVLGLIAEHLGELPQPGQCFQVKKSETQTKIMGGERQEFCGITPDDCISPPRIYKTNLVYRYGNVWQLGRGNEVFWVDPALEDIMNFREKANCLGGKCIHMSDAISGVSIAPIKPQTPEDMKVLEYLAGLRFAEK